MNTIKQLRLEERPREKLLSLGVRSLTDGELLSIFLRTGVKGKNAIELANEVIDKFGLKCLFKLTEQQVSEVKGLGTAKWAQLQAVLELVQRYLLVQSEVGDSITDPATIIKHLKLRLLHLDNEVFVVVFMDNQNRILKIEELFQGSINETAVYPRVILKRCLELNAAAVILSHNHPSKLNEPSKPDLAITTKIKEALFLIDVRLLDHIIIAGNNHYSFLENGQFL